MRAGDASAIAKARIALASYAILLVIPVATFVAAVLYSRHVSPISGDSITYIDYSYDRPVGYPLLISAAKRAFGSTTAVTPPQLGLLCASFGYLALAMLRATKMLVLSVIFELLLFANPGLFVISSQIMAEAVSTALIAVFAAVLLPLIEGPGFYRLVLLSVVAAAAFAVRPVNVALMPAALLAIVTLGDRHRWRLVVISSLVVVCAHAATPAVHFLRHDPPRPLLYRRSRCCVLWRNRNHGRGRTCPAALCLSSLAAVLRSHLPGTWDLLSQSPLRRFFAPRLAFLQRQHQLPERRQPAYFDGHTGGGAWMRAASEAREVSMLA
ncbi:MAG TPA: hypothetical protein VMF67_06360 [Rhizomicrobium sp.]|nr:hypothetical protein [Rhizomicrobium sp.]